MDPTPAPFIVQPQLTAITLAYRNAAMIADSVLPRVPVFSPDFKYSLFTKADDFTIPDTKVGRTSKPNEVDWSATESSASVRDYGLEEPIPQADIAAAQAAGGVVDPTARSTEQLSNLIALDREKRVADLVFNAASYAAANKTTLAGNDQWSDYTNSDPIGDIMAAMDTMLMRPTIMVLGRAVMTKLAMHPKIVKAFHGNEGDQGIVNRQFLAQLFELQDVLVGEAWVNSAKKGQTATFARLWGDYCALLYRNPISAGTRDMTFGVTAQYQTRVAGTRQDPDIGLRGGTRVRVGESLKELVLANDLGYLFSDCLA